MDTRKIKKLIELVKETGIGELEVKSGEDSVRISCQHIITQIPIQTTPNVSSPASSSITPGSEQASFQKTEITHTKKPSNLGKNMHELKSPMVGTVYLAPAPGSPPFVNVGQTVQIGDTLCLIEAMKMFNKIEADKAGIISARLIENQQPVEYDQPLFIIEIGE